MIVAVRRLLLAALLLAVPALAAAQTYTISPPPFLLAQNNSGAIINNACIWTYSAGTTTPATTYTTSTGTANSNPIRSDSAGRFTAYLQPGISYKFVYESACTPPAHGTTLRTADNIAAVPTSASTVDVQGTAGEAISAGQCAYLSDGSGGKNAGQWYKCDPTNTYSSTLPEVGIAPNAISSAATGTVRIAGSLSGLSSLSIGSEYFAGTAGALTSTAPTNARHLGHADSATTVVLTGDPSLAKFYGPTIVTSVSGPLFTGCGARATLTTGLPVTTADVTGATNVFIDPYSTGGFGAGLCGLYNTTTTTWTTLPFTEITVPLGTLTSGLPYDVFCYNNSGAMACELAAWNSGSARFAAGTYATLLPKQDGIPVKSTNGTVIDASRRYIATFYTTSTTQTEDSFAKRYLWNYYNRVERPMQVISATNSYTYALNAIRQSQGSATYQLNFVVGVAEVPVQASLSVALQGAGAGTFMTGFGLDTTTVFDVTAIGGGLAVNAAVGDIIAIAASITKYPAVGVHFLAWLENSPSAQTFGVFSNNSANHLYSGIRGVIFG